MESPQNNIVTIMGVGIESYVNADRLDGPINDVHFLKELLVRQPATAYYSDSDFIEIIDPTLEQLQNIINTYAIDRPRKGEILIFYFSGHGVPIQHNDYGFCTVDSINHPNENVIMPLTVLRFSDLLQTLSIVGVTPIIIIDACFSGMASKALNVSPYELTAPMKEILNNAVPSNHALLFSSAAYQETINNRIGGIFSHYLFHIANRGIKELKKQPTLSLKDIYPTLKEKFTSYTNGITPGLIIDKTLENFPFVKNTKYSPISISFGPQFKDLLLELWNDENEIELDGPEILKRFGQSIYANHSKLSYPVWNLTKKRKIGVKTIISLSSKGRKFIQGKHQIPKRIIKKHDSDEYIPHPNTKLIDISAL